MDRIHLWVVFMALIVLLSVTSAETVQVREALVQFMQKLAPGNNPGEENWGWNMSSDPCIDTWKGISCDKSMEFVKKIILDQLKFTGVLDAAAVCSAKNLAVLSLDNNNVSGILPDEVSNCTRLTHLYLHGNSFSGDLPGSLSRLSNLKRLVISDNGFTGGIPDISRVSGLLTFLAQNNQFDGVIPKFEFSNLEEFNVSNNNLSGSIPDVEGHFNASSFLGNPGLCGEPLPNACSPPPPPPPAEKKGLSSKMYLMYLGYALIGLILVSLIAVKVIRNKKNKEKKKIAKKGLQTDAMKDQISSSTSSESKRGGNISEYSITSVENGMTSSSLVVLSSPVVNGLKFEDLLRSPAELIGRGRHGSLYKVTLNSGVTLAVKRIRDWDISRDDFEKRVHRIDQVKHPHVMPVVAYYCSRQEQLLVYQFQDNGSLFRLIHGSQNGQLFDWGSRLSVAARIAEALAFMHEGLQRDGIAHGNLKSSNILLNNGMEPCISEYGLAVVKNQDQSFLPPNDSFQETTSPVNNAFKADVYGFGVILLELLTGKLVQNNGFDLGQWVNTAIREEWTAEVFDKTLVSEGASEERMVNLLQIALTCINPSPEERPSMMEVSIIINSIEEYEEKSLSSET